MKHYPKKDFWYWFRHVMAVLIIAGGFLALGYFWWWVIALIWRAIYN